MYNPSAQTLEADGRESQANLQLRLRKTNKEKLFTVRQGTPQNKNQLLCGAWFSEGNGAVYSQTEGGSSAASTCYVLCGVPTSGLRCSWCCVGLVPIACLTLTEA